MYVAKHQRNETEGGSGKWEEKWCWIMDYGYDEAGHKQGRLWRTNTGIVEYYYRYYYPGTTVVLFSGSLFDYMYLVPVHTTVRSFRCPPFTLLPITITY